MSSCVRQPDDAVRRVGRRRRRSASCGAARTTVPTAGPPSVWTTTGSPAAAWTSAGRSSATKGLRPADRRQLHRRRAALHPTWSMRSTSQLQHHPVGHDLDAGIPLERHEGPIDRRKRANAALAPVTPRQPVERRAARPDSPAPRSSAPRRQELDVAQQRRHRAQVRRQMLAIAALARSRQQSCALEPPRSLATQLAVAPATSRRRPRARARVERAPMLPSAVAASRALRSLPSALDRRCRVLAVERRNRSRGQRDRTVGSSTSGRAVTRMNTDEDGGSSSVFSSAFCAAGTSASASSMMTTRRRPSNGR